MLRLPPAAPAACRACCRMLRLLPHAAHAAPAACRACCRMLRLLRMLCLLPAAPAACRACCRMLPQNAIPAYYLPKGSQPPTPQRLQFDRFRFSLLGGALRNSQYFKGCLGRYYGCPTAVMALSGYILVAVPSGYVLVTVPYVYGAPVSKASLDGLDRERRISSNSNRWGAGSAGPQLCPKRACSLCVYVCIYVCMYVCMYVCKLPLLQLAKSRGACLSAAPRSVYLKE